MKNAVLAVSILATVVAQAAIENVTVRQLWPWSGDVDIAFTVTGSENTAVKFTAQYDGVEPFVIPEGQLSGDFFDAAPGRRHARWRVDRAGLAGKTLFNLQITAEADATDRTYLILDLANGSYPYYLFYRRRKDTFFLAYLHGYTVTRLRGYTVTRLHGYAVTRLRGYTVTRLRGYTVTRLRG